jgi:shikimate dehydrogenase
MRPVTGATRLAAVIGDPARHSLSPTIHNAAFAACGLDWVYLAFDVARGHAGRALDAMRTLGISGYSVTMPHKAEVAAAVDERTPEAAALGAVNCVHNLDGVLVGDNTDGTGFLRGLAADTGFDVAGARCVVLGAGGAARAVVDALARAGASEVAVVNRSSGPAEHAAALAGAAGRVAGAVDAVPGADLVVNATPLGMTAHHRGALPCDPALVRPGAVAVDLIYDPLETPWLAALRGRDVVVANGISMLVHQAARQFERWTGHEAPVDVMTEATARALAGRAGR